MLGPTVDSASLALGGLAGAMLGKCLPAAVKETMPKIFGIVTIAIGAAFAGKGTYLPVVVLAIIAGTFAGELAGIEQRLVDFLRWGLRHTREDSRDQDTLVVHLVTLIAAMCFGSMGLFGAVNEGLTGKPDLLLTKAVLDFFSGIVFGAALGARVSLIAVPQFVILAGLYLSAELIMPLVTEAMLQDFTAAGGIIFLATGLRMCGISTVAVINMLPSLALVMPASLLWAVFFG